ncbi:carbon-nitrogen hydrolase family protein [Winslowiella sp. 2C04]|uniref:carbon-nitrogen hydrolase family protein n=1 Tax=Winslowiella sp. 2C04 TaxID=3416179 RepID=UPI003CEA8B68
MLPWSVAAAQYASRSRDIDGNISHHLSFIQQASRQQIDLLLFPELSLSGYELEVGPQLALSLNDARLDQFAEAAHQHQMNIIVGMPLRVDHHYHIGAVTFLPDGTRFAYAKRHLLGSESQFFQPGRGGPVFGTPTRNVAIAVCADIVIEQFARDAAECGADLYAASVLVSEKTYDSDCHSLSRWSADYRMAVLMANHAKPTGGYESNGGSAFWDAEGNKVICSGSGELLMVVRRTPQGWQGEIHPLG